MYEQYDNSQDLPSKSGLEQAISQATSAADAFRFQKTGARYGRNTALGLSIIYSGLESAKGLELKALGWTLLGAAAATGLESLRNSLAKAEVTESGRAGQLQATLNEALASGKYEE